ncbi:hypothetical protein J31TS3_04600 [Paenibacillus lactis]|nr:hypothetical protein J31TS3_04600 [Paenibacillus lactis]
MVIMRMGIYGVIDSGYTQPFIYSSNWELVSGMPAWIMMLSPLGVLQKNRVAGFLLPVEEKITYCELILV